MPANIYALLVGIDRYLDPVPPLFGCVNDINAVESYLKGRVARDSFQLHLLALRDEQATREAVIAGFRQHLSQARAGDLALFYYTGHGSQEPAPPEFWHLEPDRLDETLVCWDSRQENNWDLADKELSKLIAEVAAGGPQVTIVLDCCHSGSGTRVAKLEQRAVRRAPVDQRRRPLDTFIFTPAELGAPQTSRSAETKKSKSARVELPEGRHLLLAACRDNQEAKEYYADGKSRGAFSYFLLNALHHAAPNLTARDLMKWTTALVRASVIDQMPQLEASEMEDLDRPFLGGAIAAQPSYFTVTRDEDLGWVMDGGAVHGIKGARGGETTRLALFAADAAPEALEKLSSAVAQAIVTEVLAERSKVEIEGVENLDVRAAFKAVVVGVPLPALGVCLEGSEMGVMLARHAISTSHMGQPSPYVREAGDDADFRLLAEGGQYLITRPSDGRPLVAQIKGYTEETAALAVRRLEHIARWKSVGELDNPNSRIAADAVRLTIYVDGNEVKETELRLEYTFKDGKWGRPGFTLKLKNHSDERLYCTLVSLSERYAVETGYFGAGGVWLKPRQEAWAWEGKTIRPVVIDELWEQGVTQVRDILKLIVCTAEFDPRLLKQGALDTPTSRKATLSRRSTLNRLMNRVHAREIPSEPEEDEYYDDWRTTKISVVTIRPRQFVPLAPSRDALAAASSRVALGFGVELKPHPDLKCEARLTTLTQAGSDLAGGMLLPTILREDPTRTPPLQFTAARGSDPGLSVLELVNVENRESVTPLSPLVLNVPLSLSADEHVLALGFDGEFFLPLGYAEREGKAARIKLLRLPPPLSEGRSDAEGSIKILFRKVVSQRKVVNQRRDEFDSPLLSATSLGDGGDVLYESDAARVRERVASADEIALCVHGFASDTRQMAATINACAPDQLVLAFDYANLKTPLEEMARTLKESLAGVGLGAGHGKRLRVFAHSSGGLVARQFVEREGGSSIVSELVMFGTPNGGSSWPNLQAWGSVGLGVALNNLSAVVWPVGVLSWLMEAFEKTDVASEEMRPGSEFLKRLESAAVEKDDRSGAVEKDEESAAGESVVPYTSVAGHASLIEAALKDAGGTPEGSDATSEADETRETPLFERLLGRLFTSETTDGAALSAFFREPNDMAASVASMRRLGPQQAAQTTFVEVACDHLTYFNSQDGLRVLSEIVNQR